MENRRTTAALLVQQQQLQQGHSSSANMKPHTHTATHLSWRPRSERRTLPRGSRSRRRIWWGAGCRWRWSETARSSRKTFPTWAKLHPHRCKPPRSRTCGWTEEIWVKVCCREPWCRIQIFVILLQYLHFLIYCQEHANRGGVSRSCAH